ncbi:hypothetical protein GF389_04040, partial [Candidatus Dojkabacteria bacterium]|nr:hypothetical protein [Candidatus Dojkabacteria bacterium]
MNDLEKYSGQADSAGEKVSKLAETEGFYVRSPSELQGMLEYALNNTYLSAIVDFDDTISWRPVNELPPQATILSLGRINPNTPAEANLIKKFNKEVTGLHKAYQQELEIFRKNFGTLARPNLTNPEVKRAQEDLSQNFWNVGMRAVSN